MPILYSRSKESSARSTRFRAYAIVVYYREVFPGDEEKDVAKKPWRCVDIPYIVSARDRDHALEQALADFPTLERSAQYSDRVQRAEGSRIEVVDEYVGGHERLVTADFWSPRDACKALAMQVNGSLPAGVVRRVARYADNHSWICELTPIAQFVPPRRRDPNPVTPKQSTE